MNRDTTIDKINELFQQITDCDPTVVDSTFGKYMVGCIYDVGWEGFDTEHLQGIKELLTDMELFVRYSQ